jgi:hypothetical protein
LVLVGDLTDKEVTSHGGYIPLLGAGTSTNRVNVAATVIDPADGNRVTGIGSVTTGRTGGVIYGFWGGLFLVPMTETSVYDGLAKGAADFLRDTVGTRELKIAIAHVRGFEGNSCSEGVECQPATPTPAQAPAPEEIPIPEPPKSPPWALDWTSDRTAWTPGP